MNADKQQRLPRIDGECFVYSRQFAQFAFSSVSFLSYLRQSAFICGFDRMIAAQPFPEWNWLFAWILLDAKETQNYRPAMIPDRRIVSERG